MQVFVNNKEVLTEASTLSDLIKQLKLPTIGVAAAIENKMVPHAEWEKCAIQAGAHVTIIKAACGG